ncbi:MAG: galactose oxidase-like domain-containing protein [Meiothermus sp.]|nr:galactose oxidase-like domain-containing protein [Meiothermus sp.]
MLILLAACSTPQGGPEGPKTPQGTGLSAEYFAQPDFTGTRVEQVSTRITFEWGESVPALGMRPGRFSARWTGFVQPEFSEEYTFSFPSVGTARLWVDGFEVASGGRVALTAGKLHGLRLEFVKTEAEASLRLEWSSPSTEAATIPTGRLYPSTPAPDASVSAQAPPPNQNLLLNPDFEAGTGNWIRYGIGTFTAVTPGRSGTGRAASGAGFAWVQQDLPGNFVAAGTTYTLEGWGRSVGGRVCTLGFSGGNSTSPSATFNQTLTFTVGWERKAISFAPPAGTVWTVVYFSSPQTECQFDDLDLRVGGTPPPPPPPPSTSLILSGDFEGNNAVWDVFGGSSSFVAGRASPTALQGSNFTWIQQDLPSTAVTVGATYTLSGFARANGGTCTIGFSGGTGNTQTFNRTLTFQAAVWEQQSLSVTLPTGTGWAVVYLAASAQPCQFDDLVLGNGSTPPPPLPAPTGFGATATSSTAVALSWNAVVGATGYQLERRTDSTAFAPLASPSGASFTDTGLLSSTRYTYRLRATASGTSSTAVEASATTPSGGLNGGPQAGTRGFFGPVRDWPLVATHAALLPDGRVISWYSFDRIGVFRDIQDVNADFHKSTIVSLWNPVTNSFSEFNNTTTDLFCAGWALLPDGRLLVAGGNLGTPWGSPHTNIFNPSNNGWTRGPDMRAGRWYPSVTPLPNGEMLISGGTEVGGGVNRIHEVYQTNGTLRQLTGATTAGRDFNHYFPWFHVAPNGQVFYAGSTPAMYYLNTAGTGSWGATSFNRDNLGRSYGSSVMYEPGRIMVIGGGTPATNTTRLIDLGATGGATVRAGPNMATARTNLDATLLADGTIFANGGNTTGAIFTSANAVFAGELYNPRTNSWTTMASASQVREYHSVALLLPDATVWTAGGGGCGNCGGGLNKLNYEIFYPPYLFRKDGSGELAARPAISGLPATVGYNSSFTLNTPNASSIQSVTLVAPGSSTHAFNYSQRFMTLPITGRNASSLTVGTPSSPNLAPPGFYMVFVINSDGVPSVARFMRVQ